MPDPLLTARTLLPTIPFDLATYGYSTYPLVPPKKLKEQELLENFCTQLSQKFVQYNWKAEPCGKVPWIIKSETIGGYPLIYWDYGNGPQTTLIISGVHPDEMTPIPLGFKLANYILENPSKFDPKAVHVIIAPLVNPDGFLIEKPTRTNGNEVDINRNFFTEDWYSDALKTWREKRSGSRRHFPGFFPHSEIETVFQTKLIQQFAPDKILTIHAPLGFLDYDGPGDRVVELPEGQEKKAKDLAQAISEKIENYRIVDYSFFPGSLGNYAGNEHAIPTITLELETTDPHKVERYWQRFLPGVIQSIEYPYEKLSVRSIKAEND